MIAFYRPMIKVRSLQLLRMVIIFLIILIKHNSLQMM